MLCNYLYWIYLSCNLFCKSFLEDIRFWTFLAAHKLFWFFCVLIFLNDFSTRSAVCWVCGLQLPDYETLDARLKMFMGQYNETVHGGEMDLVFFKDAMVHLIKVRPRVACFCLSFPDVQYGPHRHQRFRTLFCREFSLTSVSILFL